MADSLCSADFPPYAVCTLDGEHFLIAGGGGQARTGVPNAIEIFEFLKSTRSLTAVSKCRYDTDKGEDRSAIMNADVHRVGNGSFIMVTGKDEMCQLYEINKVKADKEKTDKDLRRRKGKEEESSSSEEEENDNKAKYVIERLKSVQSDFGKPEKYQKVVKFINDGSVFVTGGADGYIRVWKYQTLSKEHEIQAHSKEIDDLDISPSGSKIVSVSRDCKAFVWNTKDGSKTCELTWDQSKPEKAYRYRSCRFGIVEGDKSKSKLFTIHVPHVRDKTNTYCYVTKWDTQKFIPEKTVSTGTDVLSALAVSPDGNYVGLGTMSGSVAVYISFSLQKLKLVKDVHGIFVTGLSFVPISEGNIELLGNQDCSLLSISADKQCKVLRVSKQTKYHGLVIVLGFLAVVVLLILFLDYIGVPL
ncbi:guanine nucleotide-exchange factor SEC12-like [Saccoglossus kowalevskii]|uniref:Prolactin regulatory element-binding protein-like n=1 Tax=Saccoglossus kowalevskii TaxID=10224 RepID=A0ABM0M4Y3_SACKO|nr:PREDICTED: prolactin regulatory element-binding protein-like [Saccoglossus kowalevskii]